MKQNLPKEAKGGYVLITTVNKMQYIAKEQPQKPKYDNRKNSMD